MAFSTNFILERDAVIEYYIEPATIGTTDEAGRSEKIPAEVNITAVLVPIYKNGQETKTDKNIIELLSSDEIEGICETIRDREGLCL